MLQLDIQNQFDIIIELVIVIVISLQLDIQNQFDIMMTLKQSLN